jgi:glycosyltransferase involved in cell wall biosynthesis
VSIVIPAYNRERFLGATIDSVLAQTVHDWELVVADDGSTDATVDVARRYAASDPRIMVVGGSNGGVAVARNRGLAAADPQSEFVAMLDSDDMWTPDALAVLIAALDDHPHSVAAHGWARCADDLGRPMASNDLEQWMRGRTELRDGSVVSLRVDEPTTFAALVLENWVVTPGTTLIRHEALGRAGPLDPRTAPADDWQLMLRLSRLGEFAFVDRQVLWWRRHELALSETSTRWRRAHFRVRDKLLIDTANAAGDADLARAAYRRLIRGSWNEAWSAARAGELSKAARRAAKAIDGQARYTRGVVIGRLSTIGKATATSPGIAG